jgi:hypothetical protein
MTTIVAPSAVDTDAISVIRFDFDKSLEAFEHDHSKKIVIAPLRLQNKVFRLLLKGELFTDGINTAKFDNKVQSIGILLSNPTDTDGLKSLKDLFTNQLSIIPTQWDIKDVMKGDVIYLKTKTKDGKYRFQSDIKLDPKDPNKNGLSRNQYVEVQVEAQVYLNFESEQAGLFFDIVSLKTKTDEHQIKRRKKE